MTEQCNEKDKELKKVMKKLKEKIKKLEKAVDEKTNSSKKMLTSFVAKRNGSTTKTSPLTDCTLSWRG